jgi:hypothetical protein
MEEQLVTLKSSSNNSARAAATQKEVDNLRKELEKKNIDLETLKSQSAGLHKAYDELANEKGGGPAAEGKKAV